MTQTVTETLDPASGTKHRTTTTVVGDATTQTLTQGPAKGAPPAASPAVRGQQCIHPEQSIFDRARVRWACSLRNCLCLPFMLCLAYHAP